MAREPFNIVWAENPDGSGLNYFSTPSNTRLEQGWVGGASGQAPPAGEENWWHNRVDSFLQSLERQGAPLWHEEARYYAGAFATGSDAKRYVSLTGDAETPNVGNDPVTDDGTSWAKAVQDGFSVGDYKFNQSNLTGAQEPDQTRWIKLTAGEDGVGQYNEGKLINETITGSGDTVVITAQIDDIDSPMNGQVINLLNSENRYTAPGTSPGTVANDQMQQITGSVEAERLHGGSIDGQGAFSPGVSATRNAAAETTGQNTLQKFNFDSADSLDARTGTNTNVKHIQVTAYIKFKE